MHGKEGEVDEYIVIGGVYVSKRGEHCLELCGG